MIGESIYTYITKEDMLSSIQMKNAATAATAATAPVALAVPAAPAAAPAAPPAVAVPVFYPSMFDRWAIPF
jgi:hypothetical protein